MEQEFVTGLAKLCQERDWLLLVDEVQTGVGRTGSLFCYQQYGVQPDACSFAKGIAGGLPMGGFLVSEKCRAVLGAGQHGSTFGGNPVSAAAACAVLDILDDDTIEKVKEKGQYIRNSIENMGLKCLGKTRGMGLMIGVDVAEGYSNKELCAKLNQAGLLSLTAGSGLRFLPPLTITQEEMDKGLAIFKATLENL
jgi:acetylornithine/N-succinyldiaminopimelate aminotransferase